LLGGGPPDLPIPGDRLGLTLAAGLWLKETPFLLLAVFAGMNQLPVARPSISRAASAMGRRRPG
jgi:ABC-type uncharacterized transport system, permease component